MRTTLQFAALLLAATGARAQVSSPDKLVAPPPQPPTRSAPQFTDDLQWLWPFARPVPLGRAGDLRLDERFQSLIAREFKQPQTMWGTDPNHTLPLATVIPLFLSKHGEVTGEDNRYFTVDGCVPSFCPAAGLLWVDLGTPHPLMIFVATAWTADTHATDEAAADYNLWLFPNRNLDPNALPLALTNSIARWYIRLADAHRLVPHIAHAELTEPNGSPYALDPELAGANNIAPQPDTASP